MLWLGGAAPPKAQDAHAPGATSASRQCSPAAGGSLQPPDTVRTASSLVPNAALVVVEHQRRLHVVGERRHAHAKLGSCGCQHITARFPLPQVRNAAIFPPIFLERQTSSNPYLSFYLSRRVGLGQTGPSDRHGPTRPRGGNCTGPLGRNGPPRGDVAAT